MKPTAAAAVVTWLTERNGIARRDEVRAAGLSDYAIKRAVAAGDVQRIRGHWLAVKTAPQTLVRAASVQGRITCVTATSHHGLWTPTDDTGDVGHMAVAPNASRFDALKLHVHWARGPVATDPNALIDPIENVLFHAARCLPRRDALAIWESSLREPGLTLEYLRGIRWRSSAADAVLDALSILTDSGLETHFIDGIRPFGLAVRQQTFIEGHHVDALIGDRLVIQLDGFEFHSDAAQRRRDIAHDVRLTLMGYTVLRFDYAQVMFDWPYVQTSVLGAVAQGLHLADAGRRARRRA